MYAFDNSVLFSHHDWQNPQQQIQELRRLPYDEFFNEVEVSPPRDVERLLWVRGLPVTKYRAELFSSYTLRPNRIPQLSIIPHILPQFRLAVRHSRPSAHRRSVPSAGAAVASAEGDCSLDRRGESAVRGKGPLTFYNLIPVSYTHLTLPTKA